MDSPPSDRLPLLRAASGRKALAGFFVSGFVLSSLGPLFPAWGFHLRTEFGLLGNYFLWLAAGQLGGLKLSTIAVARKGADFTLHAGAILAAMSFAILAQVPPPAPDEYRQLVLVVLGVSAGLLYGGIFAGLGPLYHLDAPSSLNLAGLMFGGGCLMAPLVVAATLSLDSPAVVLYSMALIPAGYLLLYLRTPIMAQEAPLRRWRQIAPDFTSPGAALFCALLFCQFGIEWCIGGWLPLFLIQRIGLNIASSVLLLAFYWTTLLLGRIAAQSLLSRFSHGWLATGSLIAAFFGCVFLSTTNNMTGSLLGLCLIGAGYATAYPLAVARFPDQLPYYHPFVFAGLFSFATTGGLLSSFVLGKLANTAGIRVMMVPPLLGSVAVFFLLMLLSLESKLHEMLRARSAR